MSDSSSNPFASPGPLAKSAAERTDREAIELRPVSFSGKLSEEETHLLLGRNKFKILDWVDLILTVSIAAAALYLLIGFGSFLIGNLVGLFFVLLLWSLSRIRHKPYWLTENAEGIFDKDRIVIRYEGSEVHLTTAEQKIHANSHGIRIDWGTQVMLRHSLISRHWFQPGEFEIAKAYIERATEPESTELHSLITNRPDSAISIYDCTLTARILNHFKQSFGTLFTAIIAIPFIAVGVYMSMNSLLDSVVTVVLILQSVLGAFLLGLFFAARAMIYFDQNRNVKRDLSKRKLVGWIDSTGFVYHANNGVVKSRWDEQLHHTSFLDSLNLFCALANPWLIYLHPAVFESRTDWQRARKIVEMNTNSSIEAARKNTRPFLKHFGFSRVR